MNMLSIKAKHPVSHLIDLTLSIDPEKLGTISAADRAAVLAWLNNACAQLALEYGRRIDAERQAKEAVEAQELGPVQ